MQFYIFYATVGAQLALLFTSTFRIHHENVRLHDVQSRYEIQDTVTGIDVRILDIADALDHEQTLLLRKHRLPVFVLEICGVGTDSNIDIPET